MQVQLLWDEYMAESAADYLRNNPELSLVILAGLRPRAGWLRHFGAAQQISITRYFVLLSGQTGEYTEAEAYIVIMAEAGKLPKPDVWVLEATKTKEVSSLSERVQGYNRISGVFQWKTAFAASLVNE